MNSCQKNHRVLKDGTNEPRTAREGNEEKHERIVLGGVVKYPEVEPESYDVRDRRHPWVELSAARTTTARPSSVLSAHRDWKWKVTSWSRHMESEGGTNCPIRK
ncbi:hypothetical protein GW17_00044670 [Ensete ventricosum]|nr:hypothetical protein GW17_00044670 [Ensete ventricosum]